MIFLGYNNSKVEGFYIDGKNSHIIVKFIPKNIENFFPFLKHLRIGDTRLSEIHQADFKPFPSLTHISFFYNSIQEIEKDLFKFNPLLEFIWFEKNDLKFINPLVFDDLTALTTLDLRNNDCISAFADNSRAEVEKVIKIVKGTTKCLTTVYVQSHYPELLNQHMKMLEESQKSTSSSPSLYFIIGIASGALLIFIVAVIGCCFIKSMNQIENSEANYSQRLSMLQRKDLERGIIRENRYSRNPSINDHVYEEIKLPD